MKNERFIISFPNISFILILFSTLMGIFDIAANFFFENERKIERRSFLTECERERKVFEKLSASASGTQNHLPER